MVQFSFLIAFISSFIALELTERLTANPMKDLINAIQENLVLNSIIGDDSLQ